MEELYNECAAGSMDVVMSSTTTSMDISESFRAEDLSKTDFFDFVSAPEMAPIGDRTPSNNGPLTTSHNSNPASNATSHHHPSSNSSVGTTIGPDTNGNVEHHHQQPLQGYDQVRRIKRLLMVKNCG